MTATYPFLLILRPLSRMPKKDFLLCKSFITKDPLLLIRAYIIYVRPLLEYCSPVWSPHTKKEIDRIESVQRCFTKKLRGYESLSYSERLFNSNLSSLELRRLRNDLILCYKIIHNYVSIDYSDMFELDSNERTRGHKFKLRSKAPRLNCRLFFFGYRIIKVWNNLPPWCAEATTDIVFKSLLNAINLSEYLCNNHDKLYFDGT